MGLKLPPGEEAKHPPGLGVNMAALIGQAAPSPSRQPPAAPPPPRVRVVVEVPGLVTASEANAGGKLRASITRKRGVKEAVGDALPKLLTPLALPVVVKLTRIGTGNRPLDDDNLRRALKAVRDVVAAWLGVDDADRRVRWRYAERRGYSPAVVIDVRTT